MAIPCVASQPHKAKPTSHAILLVFGELKSKGYSGGLENE